MFALSLRSLQLIYKDLYACDLAVAMSSGAIEAADKPYYMACIYSGLRTIHELGLLHRFVNSSSIYITTNGVPKVTQLFIFVYLMFPCSVQEVLQGSNLDFCGNVSH